MPDIRKKIENFTKDLILLLASQLRILYTKEIYSDDQDERYFTTYILNKYTGNTFIEKIKLMLDAFPDMLESNKDIVELIGQNIPPPTWNPNEIPQNIAKVLMDMGTNTNALMSQGPAGGGERPTGVGGAKKRTKRRYKKKKIKKHVNNEKN